MQERDTRTDQPIAGETGLAGCGHLPLQPAGAEATGWGGRKGQLPALEPVQSSNIPWGRGEQKLPPICSYRPKPNKVTPVRNDPHTHLSGLVRGNPLSGQHSRLACVGVGTEEIGNLLSVQTRVKVPNRKHPVF